MTTGSDEERRARLRAFVMECRSRLNPIDVGLPETRRRRVPGLRREEVAELAGVSSDWYRWFESGRPIQVSARFLVRLSEALHLNPFERRTLYSLASPDLYDLEATHHGARGRFELLSPVQSLDETEAVVRRLAKARDEFLSDNDRALPDVRPRIVNSWRRSISIGANSQLQTVPAAAPFNEDLTQARNASEDLLAAAKPTLSNLKNLLLESGFAVLISNVAGCVLELSADSSVLRKLSRIDFEPGADLSEAACGTNAVGTAIADGRPLQLVGAENFAEAGSDLTCTAAPIRDPRTLDVIGALDVTAHYRRIQPELLPVILEAALEIEERLASRHL